MKTFEMVSKCQDCSNVKNCVLHLMTKNEKLRDNYRKHMKTIEKVRGKIILDLNDKNLTISDEEYDLIICDFKNWFGTLSPEELEEVFILLRE